MDNSSAIWANGGRFRSNSESFNATTTSWGLRTMSPLYILNSRIANYLINPPAGRLFLVSQRIRRIDNNDAFAGFNRGDRVLGNKKRLRISRQQRGLKLHLHAVTQYRAAAEGFHPGLNRQPGVFKHVAMQTQIAGFKIHINPACAKAVGSLVANVPVELPAR